MLLKQKKQEGGFLGAVLGPLAASLVHPVISSVVKGITERRVMRPGRGYNKIFLFYPLNNIEITKYFIYEPLFNGVFQEIIYLK